MDRTDPSEGSGPGSIPGRTANIDKLDAMPHNQTMFDIVIDVQGKEHSGKTSAMAVIAAHLRTLGVEVVLQNVDQLEDKLQDLDKATTRLETCRVLIRETHTAL